MDRRSIEAAAADIQAQATTGKDPITGHIVKNQLSPAFHRYSTERIRALFIEHSNDAGRIVEDSVAPLRDKLNMLMLQMGKRMAAGESDIEKDLADIHAHLMVWKDEATHKIKNLFTWENDQ
jgi:hypothetical protein